MKKFGLLGEKLSHSWSPLIHNIIYERYNIDASYELIECGLDDLGKYIDLLKKGIYQGFNVTIPYKKSIMRYLDDITLEAEEIGSVNTIFIKDGKVIGANTDYCGFLEELKFYGIDCKGKNAYVLGTGGASLAIVKVLKDLGSKVCCVSRNPNKDSISYDELNNIENIDILVNTTPVGMYPKIGVSPVSSEVSRRTNVVVDIIFNPLKTKLLEDSNSEYHGLFMLVGQAIEAECIWLEKRLSIDINEVVNMVIKEKGL